ncbi:hypothetical protein P280DRAFT_497144 [Massarina eburnea CBS 473.64]|uniref:NmrA-like domain-containing protein n=1 Tax=Massarina eburnea CBS 473.64 TaxID=1395130 RepID=A0A6A6S9L4_9PLEO|nr:hypothetical protein P280DRAFT_497144 [Massarina eburnea CBS 473.64]
MSPQPTKILLSAGELALSILPHPTPLPSTHLTISRNRLHHHTPTNQPTSLLNPTHEVLKARPLHHQQPTPLGKKKSPKKLHFFPWQWSVDPDTDITGNDNGNGNALIPLLSAQKKKKKEPISISISLLLAPFWFWFWGIENRTAPNKKKPIILRASRDQEHKVTMPDDSDTGRVVASEVDARDRIVYAAGGDTDTISYAQLASIVSKVMGKEVRREEWRIARLGDELAKDPGDLIKKYRLVFAREGAWWDKEGSVNAKLGIEVMDVETYARGLFEEAGQ